MTSDILQRQANWQQARASDPLESQLASANAGSGKTKVLVDRVCRILCMGSDRKQGPDPGKILCLTYTKAAANEMQSRLFATLGEWSILSQDDLNRELNKLFNSNRERTPREIAQARELFARALETPEGLKVQTIHAFCERVLGRFPLEAGITPGFEPLDEIEQTEFQQTVTRALMQEAVEFPEGDLAWALRELGRNMANNGFDQILKDIAHRGDAIANWRENGGIMPFANYLGLSSDDTAASVMRAAWETGPLEDIRLAAQRLSRSTNDNDRKKAAAILSCFELPAEQAFQRYRDVILKQDYGMRAQIVTKAGDEDSLGFFGAKANSPTPEARRVYDAQQTVLSAVSLEMTRAIYIIAQAYQKHYAMLKRRARKLDFGDQIALVKRLLVNSEISDWIRYKLDYGIEHILIDEAQDTSPDQWDIIDALRDSFIEPDPTQLTDDIHKTFFAVGDEKQSIYSFQGARPKMFQKRTRDHYAAREEDPIRMQMSFRSSPEILTVVDHVFGGDEGNSRLFGEGRGSMGTHVSHESRWTRPGQVELWPLTRPPENPPEETPWDTRPVDAPDQSSSREKLARRIAVQIKSWLDEGQAVNAREKTKDDEFREFTRPVRAEDVLILVKKRDAFFNALIRNLKSHGVPVAGADRLVLKDAVVVKDMLALSRFILLPTDDLSLAEVLRSPLIDISEDDLFDIAHGRGEAPLWEALKQSDLPAAKTATGRLTRFLQFASKFAPFEFYTRVLDEWDAAGRSLKYRVFKRLGMEAEDALHAFLSRALAYQRTGSPSLLHFVQSFEQSEQEIKRELDRADGEVRVMTVHGAKGLQAPIVILPDTTQIPKAGRQGGRLIEYKSGMAFIPSKSDRSEAVNKLHDMDAEDSLAEYMRLLYVAMTRAESRLVICGFHSGHKNSDGVDQGSWYDVCRQALSELPSVDLDSFEDAGLVYGGIGDDVERSFVKATEGTVLPSWIVQDVQPELESVRNLTPSDLLSPTLGADMPLRSPVSQTPDRFSRGNIIHKLLEVLPDIDPKRRSDAAYAYLAKNKYLSPPARDNIAKEVFAVLDHPEFAPLFAPGSQAEVSLAGRATGLPEDVYLSAQIDRLAVTDETVYIIDFKSNRPPPRQAGDVPDIYWGQMAAYRAMIADIYPQKAVKCALLWTDGPTLMELDAKGLDAALTKIGTLLT